MYICSLHPVILYKLHPLPHPSPPTSGWCVCVGISSETSPSRDPPTRTPSLYTTSCTQENIPHQQCIMPPAALYTLHAEPQSSVNQVKTCVEYIPCACGMPCIVRAARGGYWVTVGNWRGKYWRSLMPSRNTPYSLLCIYTHTHTHMYRHKHRHIQVYTQCPQS